MMRLLDMLHHFVEGNWVEQVGWVLLHSLWQITLIRRRRFNVDQIFDRIVACHKSWRK